MTMTNKHNLPDALVRAIERHHHEGAKYSASMLSNSPRQVWLKKRHADQVVEDAMDRVWAALGTSFHMLMHEHTGPNELSEEYMAEIIKGVPVSGTADLYLGGGHLNDYKTTSVWSIVHGSKLEEWTNQINVYALGFRLRGFPVETAAVVALLRDWSASFAAKGGEYPQTMVVTVPINLWTQEEQERWVRERVALFESFEHTDDSELPLCTPEERWERDGKPPKRCDQYCDGQPWCDQRQCELKQIASNPLPVKAKRTKKEA